VHRLDKPTSGLLLCAKTKTALLHLNRAFAERRVSKRYHAIVGGNIEGDVGRIDSPVDGKSAVTTWRVLQRTRSLQLGGGHLTELELRPLTGRTHQLRIHCAECLGAPIVGDKQHGGEDAGSGLYLSALELSFVPPAELQADVDEDADAYGGDATPITISTPAPRKFAELLRRETMRWHKLGELSEGASFKAEDEAKDVAEAAAKGEAAAEAATTTAGNVATMIGRATNLASSVQLGANDSLAKRTAEPRMWAGEDAFRRKLFTTSNLPSGVPAWAFFVGLILLALGNFGAVALVIIDRAAPGSLPPLNAFTDIANAAMDSAVSQGEVPKPMATVYGQWFWADLLSNYFASGMTAPEFVASWCESEPSRVDLCVAAKAIAEARSSVGR